MEEKDKHFKIPGIIKCKDSSYYQASADLPPLKTGGTCPAKNNFCMEVCISEKEYETYVSGTEENYGEGVSAVEKDKAAKGITVEYRDRKLSYYVGTVKAQFEETGIGEVSEEKPDVILRSQCRFEKCSVTDMLKTVWEDDERDEYLRTGTENGRDALFSLDDSTTIDLRQYVTEKDEQAFSDAEIHQIIEEYDMVCLFGRKIVKETEENWVIEPYSINMAVLFELYARSLIKKMHGGYKMLKYVADKRADVTSAEGYGAKNILKDACDIYLKGVIIPDIVLEKDKEYLILDVKYKAPTGRQNRDDRLQLLAYAYLYGAKEIGHIFPKDDEVEGDKGPFEINAGNTKVKYTMYFI